MNDVDINNFRIIKDLVSNRFSLDEESLSRFNREIENKYVDSAYREAIGDSKDLRLRVPVSREFIESHDEGWKKINNAFPLFCKEVGLKYSSYKNNRVEMGKNIFKLEKALRVFYMENEERFETLLESAIVKDIFRYGYDNYEKKAVTETAIKEILYAAGLVKFPNVMNPTVVLSLNFADWFLCSTAEKWTSCLNLDSNYKGAYWAGLPGTIIDRNRAMVYLTDGRKKEFKGISVDRTIARSWVLLDENDEINIVRIFPGEIATIDLFKDQLCDKIKPIDDEKRFKAKHKVKLLFYENDYSCFIYQDLTKFTDANADGDTSIEHINEGCGGMFTVNRYDSSMIEEPIFSFSGGLSGLITDDSKITDIRAKHCEDCGNSIYGNVFYIREIPYCEDCYYSRIRICDHCSSEHSNAEDLFYSTANELSICEDCYENQASICGICGDLYTDEHLFMLNGELVCRVCLTNSGQSICYSCGNTFQSNGYDELCSSCSERTPQRSHITLERTAWIDGTQSTE